MTYYKTSEEISRLLGKTEISEAELWDLAEQSLEVAGVPATMGAVQEWIRFAKEERWVELIEEEVCC